jgi:hypothetical protein
MDGGRQSLTESAYPAAGHPVGATQCCRKDTIFAAFTLGSWALRPSDRRLGTEGSTGSLRPAAWIFPLSLVVLLLVLSLLTLSKGPPPA